MTQITRILLLDDFERCRTVVASLLPFDATIRAIPSFQLTVPDLCPTCAEHLLEFYGTFEGIMARRLTDDKSN